MRYLSTYNTDQEILMAFSDIFLKGEWFDADITYSKGIFYTPLTQGLITTQMRQPRIKSDIEPQFDDVLKMDSQHLDLIEDDSLKSIIFDPPFLFRNRQSDNNDKMSERFSYFQTYEDLMEMYTNTLKETYKKLKKGGYLFFKCQDMTDGKFYCTHYDIITEAQKIGFTLKDIGLKISKSKLQRDAKQQNCLAKTHSFWLVFKE